jgi:hypothetical protein
MDAKRTRSDRRVELFVALALLPALLLGWLLAIRAFPTPRWAGAPQPVQDEIARLDEAADGQPSSFSNPAAAQETFPAWPAFGAGTWTYLILEDGSSALLVNGDQVLGGTSASIDAAGHLLFSQLREPADPSPVGDGRVVMVGLQGFMPTDSQDVLWGFRMQVEPGFHGLAGLAVEPLGTFAADGTPALPLDLFGLIFYGDASVSPGLSCVTVIAGNVMEQSPLPGVDAYRWQEYQIRFHLQDAHHVAASLSVGEKRVCQATLPHFSQTEIQLWSAARPVAFDPTPLDGSAPASGGWSGLQSVRFDDISATAGP